AYRVFSASAVGLDVCCNVRRSRCARCRRFCLARTAMLSAASLTPELGPGRPKPRLLFCSYHCYWDPSSGAAVCSRELLELLARRGWVCRVLCGPRLDFEAATALDQLLDGQQIAFELRQ